jgi:2-keto-4-pentenoate hydratase/2-oxohepta-3-ene-1,7-dioic acid hydratase in catechol pathway
VRRIGADDALDAVAGYACANDVSARKLQFKDKQWRRGNGFDTFCLWGAQTRSSCKDADSAATADATAYGTDHAEKLRG